MTNWSLVWWVIGLPLGGFLVQALFGKAVIGLLGPRLGRRTMGALAVLPIAAAFGIGVYLTIGLAQLDPSARAVTHTLYSWISLRSIEVPFEALIDPLSLAMVLIITGVGALIHLYATGYMAVDRDYTRFFCYLNLFVAFMLVLVLGNNLAILFIGWEGVGLCSYLLIGFWYRDLNNTRAANKAFIVNRIGDVGLALGLFLLVVLMAGNIDRLAVVDARWLSYDVIFANVRGLFEAQPVLATTCALLLFLGACGKSAQFPLYFWLPDAMAGPTPVSALIHAATMVTAGVFLLNRMHLVFELTPFGSAVVAIVGAFTALFAAVIAFGQTDIKKVLAYSTVSQLGFMFIGCGAGAYWTGMFHVTTHAFFKALLFLGAGAVIYSMAHDQDLRNYGNLRKYLPVTCWTMFAGFLAIAGVPLLSGFWSKESILGGALAGHHAMAAGANLGVIAGWVGLGVAALTAMYMTRMTWLTFFGGQERWREAHDGPAAHHHEYHASHEAAHEGPDPHGFFYTEPELARRALLEQDDHHAHIAPDHTPREAPPSMLVPLVVLAALSLAGGWVLAQGRLFETWLYPAPLPVLCEVHTYPAGIPLLWLSIAAAAAGLIAGYLVYRSGLPSNEGWDTTRWRPWRRSAARQFGYDDALMQAGLVGGDGVGRVLWRFFDDFVIEGMFVKGTGALTKAAGGILARVQTGYVRGYALLMLAGGLALAGYLVWALGRLGGVQ